MDHDTKPTHYEPPGFEPTPGTLQAACMPTMVLLRCGYLSPALPHPISAEGASKRRRGPGRLAHPNHPWGLNPRREESMSPALPPAAHSGYTQKPTAKEDQARLGHEPCNQETLHYLSLRTRHRSKMGQIRTRTLAKPSYASGTCPHR